MISTPIKDTTKLPFGSAELRLGDSDTYINHYDPVFTDGDYIGAHVDTSFSSQTTKKTRYDVSNDVIVPSGVVVTSVDLICSVSFIEWSEDVMLASSGGQNTEFLRNLFAKDYFRLELLYYYPNKINTITVVLPRVYTDSDIAMVWSFIDIKPQTVNFKSITPNTPVWANDPLGRMYIS